MTSLAQSASPITIPIFPTILVHEFAEYKIYFYREYATLFQGADGEICAELLKSLARYLNPSFSVYRKQLVVQSVHLLCVFFPQEKAIRVYTARLSRELFLLENTALVPKNFKEYVEMALVMEQKHFPSEHQLITYFFDLPNLLEDPEYRALAGKSAKMTAQLIGHLRAYRPSGFERFSDFALGLTANYVLLRIHLLKFLAILPALDFDEAGSEVKRILLETLRRLLADAKSAHKIKVPAENYVLSRKLTIAIKFAHTCAYLLPAKLLATLVRSSVKLMAKRFIAGETIEDADTSLQCLYASGRDVTLDQLGEMVVSETEADHYCCEVLKLIRGFSLHVKKGEKNTAGILRAHVSIKVSALCADFKPYAPDYTYAHVAPRLKKILLAAQQEEVFINIDAEHFANRDLVFFIYKKTLLETPELASYAHTGMVLQAYLRDAAKHLQEIIEFAKTRKLTMPVRIVKGAYWDAETVEAVAHGHDAPEFLNKEETDLNFRQLIYKMFAVSPHLQICLASHNYTDHVFAITLKNEKYPAALPIEHQCLNMTYEALSNALVAMGQAVRNYVPVGSLLVGMAYLVRRIMENSSQIGVLTIMRSHNSDKTMQNARDVHLKKIKEGLLERDHSIRDLNSSFFNVTPLRLYREEERKYIARAIKVLQKSTSVPTLPNKFPIVGDWQNIYSSSAPERVVGRIQFAQEETANRAVAVAYAKYNTGDWSRAPWVVRSAVLLQAADLMLAQRNELAAHIIFEAGKSVLEALGDVDEAIDFLTFYAREEQRLNKNNLSPGSRGVFAVIAPWNFPLAIPCGMTAAALVAGNSVILKSAEQTPLIAAKLVGLLHAAGVPEDVLLHIPGAGEIVGAALVEHQHIAGIVFTGSKDVGMRIAHKAGKRIVENKLYGSQYPVKVIAEMGGKNAIIVTANAEMDETVAGILYSAFGHSGQKCSAAARVIVDNKIKDRLIQRLREACADMQVGAAYDFSVTMNPLISKDDCLRLKRQVREACLEVEKYGGNIEIDRSLEELPGYCMGPAIFDIPLERAKDPASFARRELFGPVLHIIGFSTIAQAIDIFNSTDYALTGGIFGQSQDDIDYISAKMKAGNIYINRSITGARVAIEPFGGFKLSGTGPKAGGKSYLNTFHLGPLISPQETHLIKQTPADEEGANYAFDLCPPATLSREMHAAVMDSALASIVQNFEVLFQGLYIGEKKIIVDYRKWLKENIELFQHKESANRKIPGQLSYNDFTLDEGAMLIIGFEERAYFSTVMECLAALSLGLGVTVLTRNTPATNWWLRFRDFFIAAGMAKKSFDIYFSSAEILSKTLQKPTLRTIIVDGNLQRVRAVLDEAFDEQYNEKIMKSILTPFASPAPQNFKRLLEQYTFVRSFAVNIMRHGAPLDLDFLKWKK